MTHIAEMSAQDLLSPFAEAMQATLQQPQWHGEGNVLRHTMMVEQALAASEEFKILPAAVRFILRAAALMHDIGKIRTTRVTDGVIEAPRHALVGSMMAREYLWTALGLSGTAERMQAREAIANLIRFHGVPLHMLDNDDAALRLHRVASVSAVCPDFSWENLLMLAQADIEGRISDDREDLLYRIDLCRELALEEDCLRECYPFPDLFTRRRYLQSGGVWKDQLLHDTSWGEVILMCGLPGTGKDTWIRTHHPDLPMVSLDAIRLKYRILPTKDQGRVALIAREEAKDLLRKRQPFVWNATNITSDMRRQLVNLFETYGARVRIVYLETDWQTLHERNLNREAQVPPDVISGMLSRLSPPLPSEARTVEWHAV